MFNTIYADREGHIMMLHGGQVPKRPLGDWNYWKGIIRLLSCLTTPGDYPPNRGEKENIY